MSDREDQIKTAQNVLAALGLPPAQQNERSALCLLALLNLTPTKPWAKAEDPRLGITPLMTGIREHYGKDYAPNTRETFRCQSMHQFCDAGIALYNPDASNRPVNSPKAVYQIAWETEVWVADAPSHLIHFDGVRFLGPYPPASPGPQ